MKSWKVNSHFCYRSIAITFHWMSNCISVLTVHKKLPKSLVKYSPKFISNLIILINKQLSFSDSSIGFRVVSLIKYTWTTLTGRIFFFKSFQNIFPKGVEENKIMERNILQNLQHSSKGLIFVARKQFSISQRMN